MNQGVRSVVLGVPAAIALLILIWELRTERRQWDRSSWLVLGLGWVMSSASAWGVYTGTRSIREDRYGNLTVTFSGLAALLSRFAWPLVILGSLALVAVSLRRHTRVSSAGVAFIALWLAGVFANGYNHLPISLGLFATGAALLASTVLPSGRGAMLGAAVLGLTVAIASALVIIYRPDGGTTGTCRPDKCGPTGVLLYGTEGNENALGLMLACALPYVAMSFRGRSRVALITFMALMVWATGSRSSLLAVAASLAILLLCNPHLDKQGRWRGRFKPLAVFALAGGAVAGIALPFVTRDSNAYSLRGRVWMLAKGSLRDSWLFGFGADGWGNLRAFGKISAASNYSTHNLWLDLLFSGGLVAFVFAILGLWLVWRNGVFWASVLPLSALLFAGILERPWTPLTANWLVWVLPALILTVSPVVEKLPPVVKPRRGRRRVKWHRGRRLSPSRARTGNRVRTLVQ